MADFCLSPIAALGRFQPFATDNNRPKAVLQYRYIGLNSIGSRDKPQQCLGYDARLFLGDPVTRAFDVDRLDVIGDVAQVFANHWPETADTA